MITSYGLIKLWLLWWYCKRIPSFVDHRNISLVENGHLFTVWQWGQNLLTTQLMQFALQLFKNWDFVLFCFILTFILFRFVQELWRCCSIMFGLVFWGGSETALLSRGGNVLYLCLPLLCPSDHCHYGQGALNGHNKRKDGRYIVKLWFCHFLDKGREVKNLWKRFCFIEDYIPLPSGRLLLTYIRKVDGQEKVSITGSLVRIGKVELSMLGPDLRVFS